MVQLIRPVNPNKSVDELKESSLRLAFTNLIANVDISACGVSYDGKHLYENYPAAILHAKEKVFSVNEKAKMYIERRIIHRTGKLIERGWVKLIDIIDQRDIKINQLLTDIDFDYIREYEVIVGFVCNKSKIFY